MPARLILASASPIRQSLLRDAGVEVEVHPARVDEDALRASLLQDAISPRDIADTLAEQKARKVSARFPEALVLGCDQVLVQEQEIMTKPADEAEARAQLQRLRGTSHELLSAAVLAEAGKPVWRHVDMARLTMRSFSDTYLEAYLGRNWPAVGGSVGAYQLEAEGVRLFSRIEGSHFTVLGLPLLPILLHLGRIGAIDA